MIALIYIKTNIILKFKFHPHQKIMLVLGNISFIELAQILHCRISNQDHFVKLTFNFEPFQKMKIQNKIA
jgi:hypothetical protein